MRTTATPSTRRARALLVAVATGAAGAALALGAAPAGAAPGPIGSGPGPIVTPTLPRPCAVITGCREVTTFPFVHNGHSVYAGSTFPQGSTGYVRYTMSCPDGYSETRLVTIAGTRTSAKLSDYGEHAVLQTCTLSQSVAPTYATVAYLAPPDSDELWASRHIEFFNVPAY